MSVLPDKIGDLIRLAVKDLTLCEANPNYSIDMSEWHGYCSDDDVCYVCLAGCVLAQTVGLPRYQWTDLTQRDLDLTKQDREKIVMLDLLRVAKTNISYLTSYVGSKEIEKMDKNNLLFNATRYQSDPGQFKIDMLILANSMDKYDVHYVGD